MKQFLLAGYFKNASFCFRGLLLIRVHIYEVVYDLGSCYDAVPEESCRKFS